VKLVLNQEEACAALGVSRNHWKTYIRPNVKAVYLGGSKVGWTPAELQRYVDRVSA
jgi:hypothetical protein